MIPGFNIFFTSSDDEKVMDAKSEALTLMYMDHFALHSKSGFKTLILHLHKLGFKAPNDALTLKRILHDKVISKTKFNATNVAAGNFNEFRSINHKKKFAVSE